MSETSYKIKPTGNVLIYTHTMDGRNASFAGMEITLDEEIDFDVMDAALRRVSRRFSYMNKQIVTEDEKLFFVPCESEVVLHRDDPGDLINEQVNDGLLFRFGVCGPKLMVSMFHCLSDGKGIMNYIGALLWEYYGIKHPEETKNRPATIPDINEEPDPEEYTDPMSRVPEGAAGETKKEPEFFLPCGKKEKNEYHTYTFSCEGTKLMAYARESDGTPNAVMAVALARAIRHLYPESEEKGITVSVAVDAKPVLGIPRSTLPCLQASSVHFDQKMLSMDNELLHTCVRGKLIADCEPEKLVASINRIRVIDEIFGYMHTLSAKRLLACRSSDIPRSSCTVSYAGIVDFGSISHHIRSIYSYADAASPLLEISFINNRFFFTLFAGFDAGELAAGLCRECEHLGFECSMPEHHVLRGGSGKSDKPKFGLNRATFDMISAVRKYKKTLK